MTQGTQTGAQYQPRVVGGGGRWEREVQKGGDICIPMAASFEVCRKQQNSVKQLSFNKKIKDNQQGSIV